MTRPNWFLAFPIPGDFVFELPPTPRGFRRFAPEDVHLTLCFLGSCSEDAAKAAFRVLDEELGRAPEAPLGVSLGKVVPMGPTRSYSALSALLSSGNEATVDCLTRLRDKPLLAATGRTDRRPAKPHVTLARPRHAATAADRELGLTWASSLELQHVRAVLDRVALYTWDERRAQRLFRIVAERRLAP